MRNDDETEFVTLDRWEQEYNYFKKIIKVGTGMDRGIHHTVYMIYWGGSINSSKLL